VVVELTKAQVEALLAIITKTFDVSDKIKRDICDALITAMKREGKYP